MRDPRELLAMLAVKVQRFQPSPGGIPVITAEDIAHILGMIKSTRAALYARIKYSGQDEYAKELSELMRTQVLSEVEDIARWKGKGGDWVLKLCQMALVESIDPNTCSWCNGVAEVTLEDGQRIECGGCNGSGHRPWRDKDRARLADISPSAWCNYWSERYRTIQQITCDRYEELICGAIAKRRG